ncbi:MAG TPA: hypothetical protein ENI37_08175 [Chloroflexi bacterium]|nr:hypothetical protein [Chloroflexota bacterium]
MTRTTHQRNTAGYQFLLLLAIYLLSASLRIDSADGETMYHVSHSLVTGRGLAIPAETTNLAVGHTTGYGKVGPDGHYYSKYGLGWSLVAVPFCALGRALTSLLPGATEGFMTRVAVMLLNPLLTATSGTLLFYLARRLYPTYLAVTLTLLYGLGTIAWYYAQSAFSEPLVTLLLLGAILAVERGHLVVAGSALGGMIFTRQTALLLALPVTAWALIRERQDRENHLLGSAAALLLPIALGQLAVLGYNACRFGDLLDFGYGRVAWNTPLLLGLYNQLLSPGKGLFVFVPVLLLSVIGWPALLRRRDDLAWLVLTLVLFYLVPHALYGDWSAGGGWGPRLLLPIVPFALLPAGEVIQRWQAQRTTHAALTLLVALSLFIQVLGVSVNWARHLQRVTNESATRAEYFYRVHYYWPDSPIPGQLRSLAEVVTILRDPASRATLKTLVNPETDSPLRDWQSEAVELISFNVPDFCLVYLWFLGLPTGLLAGVALTLTGVATGTALLLQRALKEN